METLQQFDNDALLVDDLLDFSNGDIGGLCEELENCEATVCGERNDTLCCQKPAQKSSEATVLSSLQASGAGVEALYTPPDELAELEWLSSFVEDSYTADRPLLPLLGPKVGEDGKLGWRDETDLGGRSESESAWFQSQWLRSRDEGETFYNKNGCELLRSKSSLSLLEEGNPFIEAPSISNSCDASHPKNSRCSSWGKPSHIKGRTRSRRPKSEGRIWSLHMLAPTSHHHSSKRPAQEYQDYEDDVDDDFFSQVSCLDYEPCCLFHKHKKKAKKSPSSSSIAAAADGMQEGQRCSHCQVQKTPQWRAGPLGPKTLCNACGVRYKSGRLVPEYRPAASPTFVNEIHSNSHKKILEMRLYKSRFGEPEEEETLNTRMSEEESSCSQESMTSQLDG